MEVSHQKLQLIRQIINTEDEGVILQVRQLLEQSQNTGDFWNELDIHQQEMIKISIQESLEGKTIDYESFMSSRRT